MWRSYITPKGYMAAARQRPRPFWMTNTAPFRYDPGTCSKGISLKMGEFRKSLELDSQAKSLRLVAAWKLHEGDPYDSEYAQNDF